MSDPIYSPQQAVAQTSASCQRANNPQAQTKGLMLDDCCKKSLKEIEQKLMLRQVLIGTSMGGAIDKTRVSPGKSWWEALKNGLEKLVSIGSEDWKETTDTARNLSVSHKNAVMLIVQFELDTHEYRRQDLIPFWQCIGNSFK